MIFLSATVRGRTKEKHRKGSGTRLWGACAENNPHLRSGMEERGNYRYEATTVSGFIQQLAVSYLANGYFFYVMGHIPEGKDPCATDKRIIDKYGIAVSKFIRYRRKENGRANLQY